MGVKHFHAEVDARDGWSRWTGPDPVAASPDWARPLKVHDFMTGDYRIVLRTVRRRRPLYFAALIFFRANRGTTVLRLGRRPWQ